MKNYLAILILSVSLFFGGCASVSQRQATQIVRLVNIEKNSEDVGRFDLAKKANSDLIKLIGSPKKEVVVKPITKVVKGQAVITVVLPKGTNLSSVVDEEDTDFNEIVNSSASNKSAEKDAKKLVVTEDKKTNDIVEAKIEAAAKPKATSWFSWFLTIFGSLGLVGVIGIILLLCFFPALAPLVISIAEDVIGIINSLIGLVAGWFKK